MKKNNLYLVLIIAVFAFTFSSCQKEDLKSDKKMITAFTVLSVNGTINESEHTIDVVLPYGTDVTSLTPAITVSEAATVFPASNTTQNFTSPVTYTVTAEDNSKQTYIVTVTVLQSDNSKMLTFDFDGLTPAVKGIISEVNKTVSLEVPRETDVTTLVPTITISEKATVVPASGSAQNFTNPLMYTVTAQDGSETKYEITVSFEPSSVNFITEFKFEAFTPPLVGVIDNENGTVTFTIPWDARFSYDYDRYNLIPTITVSEGAALDTPSGEAASFHVGKSVTVTAENGDTKVYTIILNEEEAPAATVDLPLIVTEYAVGDTIYITGTNFTHNCSVVLESATIYGIVHDITKTSLKIHVENSYYFPVGIMNIKLKVRDQEFDLGDIKILPPPPTFSLFQKSTSDGNKILEIRGANFVQGKNEVFFAKDGIEEKAWIKSESGTTRIYVIIPPFIATGDYNIKVVADGQASLSSETVSVTMSTSTEPVITGVNKTIVADGETLEIYGKNFKDVGFGVTVEWMDGLAPTQNLDGFVVSAEKITVVIDRNKLSSNNKYVISLKWFGLVFSENVFYNITVTD